MPDGSGYPQAPRLAKATKKHMDLAERIANARARARSPLERTYDEHNPNADKAAREQWVLFKLAQVERKARREHQQALKTQPRARRTTQTRDRQSELDQARDRLEQITTRHRRAVARVREQERSGRLTRGDAQRALREERREWDDLRRDRARLRSRIAYLTKCVAKNTEREQDQ